jgi:hypothetical protein
MPARRGIRLLAEFLVVSALVVGCGGRVNESSSSDTDAGTDSAIVGLDAEEPFDIGTPDTRPTPDTWKDFGLEPTPEPTVCDHVLPSFFECTAPTATDKGGPPSKDCTEADLEDFVMSCIYADYKVGPGCTSWKDAHPACNTCVGHWALSTAVIPGQIYPDRDKCYYQLLDPSCSTSFLCMSACDEAVCDGCDPAPGSGASGKASEWQECVNRERAEGGTGSPKGACYDLAAGAALKCLSSAADLTSPCVVNELFAPTGTGGHPDVTLMRPEVLVFYRGACRDGGDWTKSSSP